jgi:hypothetical protein
VAIHSRAEALLGSRIFAEAIKERLAQEPFESFRIVTSAGTAYDVRDPQFAVLLKSSVWIAIPHSDRVVQVPYVHVAAVEAGNGHGRRPGRGKHQR